jgi:hypothetical protein
VSTVTRLYDAIKDFPDPAMAEMVDFAEFLRAKRLNQTPIFSDEPLLTLSGGLEDSKTFAADALVLQARMRGECKSVV